MILLRSARRDEAGPLSDLALRSKAYWGYDEAFIEACRGELTVRPGDIDAGGVVVACEDVRVVGFFVLNGDPPEGELHLLYVDSAHIGKGVGRRLWDRAVALAKDAGLTSFTIHADPHASDFYKRMGAVEIGTTPSGSIPGRRIPLLRHELP